MGYKVVWSPEAIEDLESIADYIGRDSEFYARAVVSKILQLARSLKDFPWIGRVVPELNDENIRERFIYSYRVVYHIEQNRILVVAIIHGKRLIENISDRFGKLT
ncbi:type II toxin-antitoxin system RelE/ParE family toxin [Methylomicrobium lacus]|uniref:type II toxin-antitoxin system RelE/ParE family toxin n=1 Tax=Methylomicrobium lacus TaxID=136992 RepID=UPI0035A9408D